MTVKTTLIGEAKGGSRTFLSLHAMDFVHQGESRKYFVTTRGKDVVLGKDKKPDAVVIVALYGDRVVVTKEHRPPIGGTEFSFPAGLIDEADYEGATSVTEAAKKAAVREFKEETGMLLTPVEVSPSRIYSSAGMTTETSIIVMGHAEGEPSKEFLEPTEDIDTFLMNQDDIRRILHDENEAFSKVAWPFLWSFAQFGVRFDGNHSS